MKDRTARFSAHVSERKISMAVVRRLPRYYRYISDLMKAGITKISSRELSEKMKVTASQIRQDFNCFGGFGQQGYGYSIECLYKEIGKILGINNDYKTIIIGAGNMGRALANYSNFKSRGFTNIGIFDKSVHMAGSIINGIVVKHMDELDDFILKNKVDIAMLCVPHDQTKIVAEKVASFGIRALWNFSPMDLQLDEDIIIENVHLSDSLMVLGYKLELERQVKNKKKKVKNANNLIM